MKRKNALSPGTQVFIDSISFIFSVLPGVFSWYGLYYFLMNATVSLGLRLILGVFILVFSFIFLIAVLRLCIPKLQPGYYKIGLNKMTVSWFMHLALSRAIYVARLEDLIKCMSIFKYLYYRALGADIPFQMTSSLKFDIVDASLVKIGKHSVIGDQTTISCHMFRSNLLYLAPNIIGENVQISAACILGPGNTIGNHCKLGYGTKLLNRELKPYSKLNDHESD